MARYKNKDEYEEAGKPRINPLKAKPYNVEYAEIAQNLAATGATEDDIAFLLGTNLSNLRKWKKDNPDFKRSLKRGKELTQTYLIGKGLKAAGGYTYTDKIIEYVAKIDKNGNVIEVIDNGVDGGGEKLAKVKEIHKTVPPNEKLLMFLVSALDRQLGRDNWIQKQSIETKIDKTVTHKLDASSISEQIDKLSGNLTKYVEAKEIEQDKKLIEAEFEDDERSNIQENKQES